MTISHAQAAKVMGMKEREITDVAGLPGGGYVVTTFDGQRTQLLTGKTAPLAVGEAPAGPAEQEAEKPAPAKRAPAKTQGRGKGGRGKQPPEDPPEDPPAGDVYPAEGAEADRLAWVGESKDRAAAALEVEQDRDTPDEALVAKLLAIAG